MTSPLFSFSGVGSGLDTKGIIDALMGIQQQPLVRLQAKEAALTAQKADYATLNGLMQTFLAKIQAFTTGKLGASQAATSSVDSVLSASAGNTAASGSYGINVIRLATSTKATSTASIGTPVTNGNAINPLNSLPLATPVTAGDFSVVVDGLVTRVNIADPAATSLQDVINGITSNLNAQIGSSDPTAVVTGQVVNNRLSFSVSGATFNHTIRFGLGGDTSNAAAALGLSTVSSSTFIDGNNVVSSSNLGVAQSGAILDKAGIPGLAQTTTGLISINGVQISYDSTVNSLNDVLDRINKSTAGVTASLDRANDRVVLTSKTPAATAIDLQDLDGNLLSSLHLAPGTVNAQTIGVTAQVSIDGGPVTNYGSNTISNAIPGVTLTLKAAGATTLSVSPDSASMKTALTDLVSSFNAFADQADKITNHISGSLRGDLTVGNLVGDLRGQLLQALPSLTSGPVRSIQDLGVTTGKYGSAVGSTSRLTFDSAKFDAALAADPAAVATVLGDATSSMAAVAAKVTTYTKASGTFISRESSIDSQVMDLKHQEDDLNSRLATQRAALEAQWAQTEALISSFQRQLSGLSAQVNAFNGTPKSGA